MAVRHDARSQRDFLDHREYHIVWFAPLAIEAAAALVVLDERHHGQFRTPPGVNSVYKAGSIAGHNVAIATFAAGQEYGTNSAATIAKEIEIVFPNVRFVLLVGVAAGLPTPDRDIRLGDVLVAVSQGDAPAVVDYQLGKETAEAGFVPLRQGYLLNPIPRLLGAAINSLRLEANEGLDLVMQNFQNDFSIHRNFSHPGQDQDVLTTKIEDGSQIQLDRPRRLETEQTRLWYGTIGSGNKLLKNSTIRDQLRDKFGLIGLEMEVAGMMNILPTGVIRGVCDYGDEQKNKAWQPYAAAVAASYAKALLASLPSTAYAASRSRRPRSALETVGTLGQEDVDGIRLVGRAPARL
ncbi:nucleoside phosphorylase domain-containing protein [Microdochium trichocladiopsis]|uniref:Nucleoside phosphorylase domain-containing protein n=1 Tax=Microdochium trichocladiopsis TaxID=1682393 RepID=A0A9P8Y577_9PEZI|nr:nucleoside phosphorylase domain-containing protein [Microdochium trichocladiopsis]KAH7029540.1 nucleoside phosphorylase domain-containing protein [Microdochium trichocladiopsis]